VAALPEGGALQVLYETAQHSAEFLASGHLFGQFRFGEEPLCFRLTQPSRNFRNGSFGVRELAGEPFVGALLKAFLHIGRNRVVRRVV